MIKHQKSVYIVGVIVIVVQLVMIIVLISQRQTLLQRAYVSQTATSLTLPTPTPTFSPYEPLDKNGFIDYPPNNVPEGATTLAAINGTKQTVTYCNGMQMDIYTPTTTTACMPATIYVHGGGWVSGSRSLHAPTTVTPNTMNNLLAQGYVVTSIDYKMGSTPSAGYPQNIQDVSCAVRYLRANATQLKLDPNQIGLWGDSAGGHLVALAGLANQTGGFDTGAFPGVSSKVQAVADLFGPITMATGVFGTAQANPITWISTTPNTDPPFLILQGTNDSIVPQSNSQALYDALIAAGQKATLQIVQGAGHEFVPEGTPSNAQLTTMMTNFFTTNLKKKATCDATPTPPVASPTFTCLGNCPTGAPTTVPSQAVPTTPQTTQGVSQAPTAAISPAPSSVAAPSVQPNPPAPNERRSLIMRILEFFKKLLELLLNLLQQ